MCREMSQYMPNSAVISATVTSRDGRADQPGRPVRRSAQAAALRRMSLRPLRWELASQRRAAVAISAPLGGPVTSPIAAPRAGVAAAAAEKRFMADISPTRPCVTRFGVMVWGDIVTV